MSYSLPTNASVYLFKFVAHPTDPILGDSMKEEINFIDIINVTEQPEELQTEQEEHCEYKPIFFVCNAPAFYEDKGDWLKRNLMW